MFSFDITVPVLVVHVLAEEGVGLDGAVGVDLWHVHVVDEVDETLGARRTVVAAGLLLQRLLQHVLQHFRRCVEVEGHINGHPVF